jgi:hypothetical protein
VRQGGQAQRLNTLALALRLFVRSLSLFVRVLPFIPSIQPACPLSLSRRLAHSLACSPPPLSRSTSPPPPTPPPHTHIHTLSDSPHFLSAPEGPGRTTWNPSGASVEQIRPRPRGKAMAGEPWLVAGHAPTAVRTDSETRRWRGGKFGDGREQERGDDGRGRNNQRQDGDASPCEVRNMQ